MLWNHPQQKQNASSACNAILIRFGAIHGDPYSHRKAVLLNRQSVLELLEAIGEEG